MENCAEHRKEIMFLRKLQKRIFGYLPVYAEFPEDHRIRKEIIYRIVAVNETK